MIMSVDTAERLVGGAAPNSHLSELRADQTATPRARNFGRVVGKAFSQSDVVEDGEHCENQQYVDDRN
jgi:hypothetical protein